MLHSAGKHSIARRASHSAGEHLAFPILESLVPPPDARLWPDCGSSASAARSTVRVAVLCPALTGAPQGCFQHCGPSASHIATFGPRSRPSDIAEGVLFYFAVLEWVSPLSFPCFGPRSRWFRTAACTERAFPNYRAGASRLLLLSSRPACIFATRRAEPSGVAKRSPAEAPAWRDEDDHPERPLVSPRRPPTCVNGGAGGATMRSRDRMFPATPRLSWWLRQDRIQFFSQRRRDPAGRPEAQLGPNMRTWLSW